MDAMPTTDAASGLTRHLAAEAAGLRYATLSDEGRALAKHCLLDYLACTLTGAREPLVLMLLAELRLQGGAESASVVGHAVRLPLLPAALVNGAAAHALDFDDVNMAMPGHPSVAILPGLLALAEESGAPGADLLAAFVAGHETACRAGLLVAPGHYNQLGFHATGTVGCLGAAAACARLLHLGPARTATALGIAATQAAGLKSMFGTMCKPLHAGKAAENGLLAARLAARGFTSRDDALECAQGFARTHSPDFAPEAALAPAAGGLHLRNTLFKYHAACYLTHAAIEAARALRIAHGLTPERIARVTLRLDGSCDRVCNIHAPRTGLEAKFSLRQTVAMALAGIETGRLDNYSDAAANDPALAALRGRVETDFQSGWPQTLTEVEILTDTGERLTARHDSGIPAADIAEQGRRLEAKFAALVAPILGEARAAAIVAAVAAIDDARDIRQLMALCRAG